jgi:hypothetical protein
MPFVFKPADLYDRDFLESKEGDWTDMGFTLPSGITFPDPMPGMVWMVIDGKLMMLKQPVEV